MKIEAKSGWAPKAMDDAQWLEIQGKECTITLEPRPKYCDRGNWIAKVFRRGALALSFDDQDGWPRYYMDLDRAKLEIEDWMKKREDNGYELRAV